MKKLLVLVAAFAVVNETSANWRDFVKFGTPVEVPVEAPKAGMLANAKAKALAAKALPKQAVAALEAKIVANPKTAVLAAMVVALVAEQVVAALYNNYVASNDVTEDDEDLDIA